MTQLAMVVRLNVLEKNTISVQLAMVMRFNALEKNMISMQLTIVVWFKIEEHDFCAIGNGDAVRCTLQNNMIYVQLAIVGQFVDSGHRGILDNECFYKDRYRRTVIEART